jgi:hypothetical protein
MYTLRGELEALKSRPKKVGAGSSASGN